MMKMGTVEVNAMGLACPEPVIRTKRALDELEDGQVVTIVDNEIARDNVMKLAKSKGYAAHFSLVDGGYAIVIEKGISIPQEEALVDTHDLVILITSAQLGRGDDQLGSLLMKNFLYALSETSPLPQSIFFLNSAVRLTVEGSECVESIRKLADQGVAVESCGICLDYYHLKEALAVGTITNMYNVVETVSQAKRVLTLG
jgi:selenium metabolism protein YedF